MPNTVVDELKGTADQMIKQVKKLMKEGSARRLMIRNKEGKNLVEVPLTAGVAGTALFVSMAPVISAISMFALFINDVEVLVEKYPEEEMKNDEYEVEAEIIEIRDGEDEDDDEEEDGGDDSDSEADSDGQKASGN